MKKIIIIDGCSANIVFPPEVSDLPAATCAEPGGRLLNAAIMLAGGGCDVTVMGEAGRDPLGDLIVKRLEDCGIDVSCIDRYSDGAATPSVLVFPGADGESGRSIVYNMTMAESWDSKWPRTDAGDIVVFGGFFALQQRVRQRLQEFIANARSRGALIVNLPGFNPAMVPAVTRVMPALLEDLEIADAVVTATPDLKHIFGTDSPRSCYDSKISFYSRLMVNVDPAGKLDLMYGPTTVTRAVTVGGTQAAHRQSETPLAMLVHAMQRLDINAKNISSLSQPTLEALADAAVMPGFATELAPSDE